MSIYPKELYQVAEVHEAAASIEALENPVEQFDALGFIAVENLLNENEIEVLTQAIDDLVHGRVAGFEGVMQEESGHGVRKVFNFVDYDARMKALVTHTKILGLVEQIIGGKKAKLLQDMALLKPPFGREKPWHQDNAYFDIDPNTRVVGVWIALDDATIENGCMHVISGSHQLGPHLHFQRRDWQICDADMLGKKASAIPLKRGGALFFNGMLYHGTPDNETQQQRRSIQYHYVPQDYQSIEVEERLAIFGSEGKDVSC